MDDIETPPEDAAEPGEEPGQQPAPAESGPPVSVNLVTKYEQEAPEWLEKATRKAARRFKEDRESMKDYMEKRAELLGLYAGIVEPLEYPAKGGRSAHLALLCRALLQLSARIWDAVCPAKGDAIQVLPVGDEDEIPAQRRQKHINWQIRHKIRDWAEGHRANIVNWLLSGSSFRAKFWDPIRRTTRFEYLTCDDVVLAYSEKDVDPLMPRVGRISRIRRMPRHEIEELADAGWYVNTEELFPQDDDSGSMGPAADYNNDGDDSAVRDVGDDISGIKKPDRKDPDGPRDIIEQHTWLKLPDSQRQKPVILTFDLTKKKAIRLTVREVEDPIDRMRFDMETQAQEASQAAAQQQHEMATNQFAQQSQGLPPELAGPPPEPPPPPAPPQPVRMRTTHELIHYRCFDNPAGMLGIGVGYLLAGNNLLANELSNEYLLSARFNNMKCGWLARGAFQNNKGPVQLEMGTYKQTDLDPEDLSKGIKDVVFTPPSEGLWKFINSLKDDSDKLVANVSQMSGEPGPTNETRTAAQLRNDNAQALVSVLTRLYLSSMNEEPRMIAQDNSMFMDPEEVFWVTKQSDQQPGQQQSERNTAKRDDYLGEFDFEWTADQRLQSKSEKVNESAGLINQVMNSPMMKAPAAPALIDALFRELFKSMEKPELIAQMGPPPGPPKPPPPPSPMSQVDENALFLTEKDHPVLPDDDDVEHLATIQEFMGSDIYNEVTSTGKQLVDRHKRAHLASLYKKSEAQRAKARMGGVPGGVPGMAPGPANGAPPGVPPQGGAGPRPQPPAPGPLGAGA